MKICSPKLRGALILSLFLDFGGLFGYIVVLMAVDGLSSKRISYGNEVILYWYISVVVIYLLSIVLGCWRD